MLIPNLRVDACDEDLVAARSWSVQKGYAQYGSLFLARMIGARIAGRKLRSNEIVDHINQDTLDNRRTNLRVVSKGINNQNRNFTSSISISGVRGVHPYGKTGRWMSLVGFEYRKNVRLGVFDSIEEAGELVRRFWNFRFNNLQLSGEAFWQAWEKEKVQ